MAEILIRLTALCALAALSEQLTEENGLGDGVRLITGLLTARLVLETAYALAGGLLG
ncbi:MAG: hypothetical protein IJE08_05265 [Clostridia bacterium]|nr:hypothetical protein [Clostridia bacterium]